MACGQCIPCRVRRQEEWVTRLSHECLSSPLGVSWTTLTFDEENLRRNNEGEGLLLKRDIQLFFKKLRKEGYKVRYFVSGEYGDKFGRPHFHALLFGIPATEQNHINIARIWGYGDVDPLTYPDPAQIRYCAKYIVKNQIDNAIDADGKNYFEKNNLTPTFTLMSRRPGLGFAYKIHYTDDFVRQGFVAMGGKKRPIPRYYLYDSEYYKQSYKEVKTDEKKISIADILRQAGMAKPELYHEHDARIEQQISEIKFKRGAV